MARAHRAKALGLLAKPFTPQTLCDAVDYLAARLAAGTDGPNPPARLELFEYRDV